MDAKHMDAKHMDASMIPGRPDIQAEQMTYAGGPGATGRLRLHSFRFEVFGLPGLDGPQGDAEWAGEIMAVAVGNAGAAMQRLAMERAPDGFLTQQQLDALNVELQGMADRLADAVSNRLETVWWVENQARFTEENAYDFIIGGHRAGP